MTTNTCEILATACRWMARILGSMLVMVIVVMAIAQGIPNLFTQPALVQVGFLTLALLMIGIVVGWWKELAGSILSFIGWGIFVSTVARGMNFFIFALVLPAVLYSMSYLLRYYSERRSIL